MLAAALVGFFLLINLLGTLTSSGPDDLLANAPSGENNIGLPTGVGLFAFAIGAVGVVLGVAAVLGAITLSRRETSAHSLRLLLLGAVVAFLLAGAGLYLAFSGVLSQELAYGEHEAQGTYIEPRGLAVMGAFFLSLVLVGFFRPRLILGLLAVWLVLALIFGFFGSSSLAGLNLFEETEESPVQEAYSAEVEKYRLPPALREVPESDKWDARVPLENGNSALIRGSSLLLEPRVSALPGSGGIANPLFNVEGAANTDRLRSATGDVYENGEWTQLDPVTLDSGTWSDIPRDVLDKIQQGMADETLDQSGLEALLPDIRVDSDLLAQPSALPESLSIDHIKVSPAGGLDTLAPGTLPMSSLPIGIKEEGEWNPFSRTFESEEAVEEYEWRSMAVDYLEDALSNAEAVDDPTYLQLPDSVPQRVRDLASEITEGHESPYDKAKAIEQYLKSGYSYSAPGPGQMPQLPPEGADPVDWFLFDQQSGSSTSFSSAFCVLARASQVPSRVVSGWAISPTASEQVVYGDQAHQWAEVGLKEFGWISFDPTPGGAPDRAESRNPDLSGTAAGASAGEGTADQPSAIEQKSEGAQRQPGQGDGVGVGGTVPPDEQAPEFLEETALQNLADALDPKTRRDAAEILGDIGSDSALEGLADAMFNDPDESVRETAIDSMASQEFEKLLDILQKHPEPQMRRAAALCMGRKGDARGLNPLGNALVQKPDTDEDVRAAAATALGDLLKPEAVEPLSEALATDESSKVRGASAAALGSLGQSAAAGPLEQALAEDANEDVRESAADALGELLSPSSLPPLLEGRANDPSPGVRGACSGALSRFSQAGLSDALEGASDPTVRSAAAQALGEQGDSSAADNLIEALQDPEEQVRESAQEAIENLGTVSSLENGGGLLTHSSGVSMIPGTTSGQATELPHLPVFEVQGARSVGFLRTAVGDRYENGQWYPDQQAGISYLSGSPVPNLGELSQPTASATGATTSRITVTPAGEAQNIPSGNVPISSQPTQFSVSGTLYPNSETFASSQAVASYSWTSSVPVYSEAQLQAAQVSPLYGHNAVPDSVPDRVKRLAQRITSGQSTPYQKARAIERYLKTNYTYQLADPSSAGVPAGQDPVDWFLFESQEGTCGNFSSAFVILARSVGLSARVVSGWSISPVDETQTVYTDQAHQWAEVAFDGFGWIPFEPTGSGGAPGRAGAGEAGETVSQSERNEIETLVQQLSDDQPSIQQKAQEELEEGGAEVVQTENGGAIVTRDEECFGLGVGTTTRQVERPGSLRGEGEGEGAGETGTRSPVFSVSGAANTRYLRSAVGEVYEGGRWHQLDRISLDYDNGQSIPHLVDGELVRAGSGPVPLPQGVSSTALLSGFELSPRVILTDNITITASEKLGNLPAGVVPTSHFLDEVSRDGKFHPVSGTFSLDAPAKSFSWVSRVPQFSQAQLEAAEVVSDSAYTQLPPGLPQRIRDLALDVTSGHESPYAKAKALDDYLSTQYTYRFADGSGQEAPPAGRDPVDWFLFDHLEGTCGVFSTAFVVMARSLGLPARVASGWAISPTADQQDVFTNQAHQWGEVAFEGLGWVQFEPTAPLGAPSRTALAIERSAQGQDDGQDRTASEQTSEEEPEIQSQAESAQETPEDETPEAPTEPETESQREPVSEEEPESQQEPVSEETADEVPEPQEEFVQPPDPLETVTVINSSPRDVRRKRGFLVAGSVRTAAGGLVSGIQVEIFINETKEHGGTKIGETTAERGSFRAEVTLPSSMSRGSYQLLAHAVGNDQYVESWSDPDITVYSESGIQLTGPGEVPVDTQALFRGKLLDDTGSGVADLELQVSVDGRDLPPQSTNDAGEFGFAQTFTEIGPHTVEVGFEGKDFLLGNTARLELAAVMPTELTVVIAGEVRVGDGFPIKGILEDSRGNPVGGAELTFTVGDGPPWTAVTGEDGSFATAGSTDTVGDSVVRAAFPGEYPILPSEHSSTVTARYLTSMSISGPSSVRQREELLFQGRLTSNSPTEIDSLDVLIEDRDGSLIATVATAEDGTFEYRSSGFAETGPRVVTARFKEQQRLTSSSASLSFFVVEPTVLTVQGPPVVRAGETVELRGVLRTSSGVPVPGAPVWVGDPDSQPLITEADGTFGRVFPVEAEIGTDEVEATVNISFGFEGTDRLAPSLRTHAVSVGLPWLSAEATEDVARGGVATLRGAVFLGSRPLADAVVTAGPDSRSITDETGSFTLQYPVAADASLGRNEFVVSVSDLNLDAAVPVDVKSAVDLVVVPLEEVHPGGQVTVEATLTDDTGRGIAGATLRTADGDEAVTDNKGTARLSLAIPDDPDNVVVPVAFAYDGDDIFLPLSYLAGIPITQSSFNWALWVGLPALVVAVIASGYLARRFGVISPSPGATGRVRRAGDDDREIANEQVPEDGELIEIEPEPVPDPEPTVIAVSIEGPAPDLPEVFALGEQVPISMTLTVEDGPGVAQASITVTTPEGNPMDVETDQDGRCTLTWTASRLGDVTVEAEYVETPLYLGSSDSADLRVVIFREEIVRLYNEFVEWAEGQIPGSSGRTPRELEAILSGSGLPLDFRAVDEIISRFEEADYSEHPISRRHYESMYRSWQIVVGE